ncbi:hypothetical protein FVEG_01085 [Fusarium verticillioides 7600]|uniref:Transmembrane protein n=1 Tax=Gibberella moniliformis (strain M3125 / FGSC 7600) TaxID=334819 RepID=W7LPS6_GIBM7|nr:hypothetical protein FVEG_01085 [Fusarium verticillioides 7600]EWG37495.1 hypothetical protein FVEG_01085 [Fusarium verticillioides 7600]
MISFKHHALYWVLSLLTVPLTSIRKLLFGHELFMGSIDEVELATVCLSLYSIARPVLNRFQNSHREVEVGVTKCSGLVEAADLEKPVEEISITKEPESRNGNARGLKPKKGRKKPDKGANGKPRAVQSQKKEAQNGDAKLSNGNVALQNIAAAQRLRKKSTGRQQSFFNLTQKYLDFLYFMSLGILFTHTEPLIGFGECVGNDRLQSVDRVLVSFLVMGTLEPIRQNRWDVEVSGLGMFSYCCVLCNEGPGPWASTLMGVCGLLVMGILVECSLYIKLQYWPWWPGIWFADSLSVLDIFIRVWLLVPLIDVAETVLYAISSRTRPEWYKRRLELMERPL